MFLIYYFFKQINLYNKFIYLKKLNRKKYKVYKIYK